MLYCLPLYLLIFTFDFDDDIAGGHLSAACFFCATSQNVFDFILIRFENLKTILTDAAYFSIWSYFKKLSGHLIVLAPNAQWVWGHFCSRRMCELRIFWLISNCHIMWHKKAGSREVSTYISSSECLGTELTKIGIEEIY